MKAKVNVNRPIKGPYSLGSVILSEAPIGVALVGIGDQIEEQEPKISTYSSYGRNGRTQRRGIRRGTTFSFNQERVRYEAAIAKRNESRFDMTLNLDFAADSGWDEVANSKRRFYRNEYFL